MSSDLQIQFVRGAQPGLLKAQGSVVRRTRALAFCQSEARNSERLAVVLALGVTFAPLAAEAQRHVGGTVTIGYLGNSSPSLESNLVEAFREGLRQHGYVEGQNLVIGYQWAEGHVRDGARDQRQRADRDRC
jgi:hypothetical protein